MESLNDITGSVGMGGDLLAADECHGYYTFVEVYVGVVSEDLVEEVER